METRRANSQHISSLDNHFGFWLRRASNAGLGAFARALQEKQTSVVEWILLRDLFVCDQSAPGELAEMSGLTRGAVSNAERHCWPGTQSRELHPQAD